MFRGVPFLEFFIDHVPVAKQGDNALGSIRPSFVCLHVCGYVCPSYLV